MQGGQQIDCILCGQIQKRHDEIKRQYEGERRKFEIIQKELNNAMQELHAEHKAIVNQMKMQQQNLHV